MSNDDLLDLLEEGLKDSARALVERIKNREHSAADIAQLRAMARDAGISLKFGNRPTPVGDAVLDSLRDIDPDLLN